MAYIYTSLSDGSPTKIPDGWANNVPYPGTPGNPYPASFQDIGVYEIPGYDFPDGFPLTAPPGGSLVTSPNTSEAISSNAITTTIEARFKYDGTDSDESLYHFFQIAAFDNLFNTRQISRFSGPYQDFLWFRVEPYGSTPYYGIKEILRVDVTGLIAGNTVSINVFCPTIQFFDSEFVVTLT